MTDSNTLYLHVFEWTDGELVLPALPRGVTAYSELGGESITVEQTDDALKLKLNGGKQRDVHSVVKLQLEAGPEIALIPVEAGQPRKQHGSLVNPMGEATAH